MSLFNPGQGGHHPMKSLVFALVFLLFAALTPAQGYVEHLDATQSASHSNPCTQHIRCWSTHPVGGWPCSNDYHSVGYTMEFNTWQNGFSGSGGACPSCWQAFDYTGYSLTYFLFYTQGAGGCYISVPSPTGFPGAASGFGDIWFTSAIPYTGNNIYTNTSHGADHYYAFTVPNDPNLQGSFFTCQTVRFDVCASGTPFFSDQISVRFN